MSIDKALSDLRGNIDQFFKTQFDELVDGLSANGRKLFLAKSNRKQFEELLKRKDKSFSERYFYNQLFSLKNVGYLSSQFSSISPITRRLKLEGGEIIYAVWNGNSYITQINVLPSEPGKHSAGVYTARAQDKLGKAWDINQDESQEDYIRPKNLAINGYAKNIRAAATYMPAFIKYGFGENALKDVYALFYNPCTGGLSSEWRSLQDSVGLNTQTAKKLADVLILTAERQKEVNLTVHESGHVVLKSALRIAVERGQSLENFTVFYANPTHNLQAVDRLRGKTGMKLAAKAPLINTLSVKQYLLSGNVISDTVITSRADPNNKGVSIYNAIQTAFVVGGFGSISASLLGMAGAAVGAAPFLLGQSRSLNQKVIDSPGKAVQEGIRHYREKGKKLVWDPIHKMMVRE